MRTIKPGKAAACLLALLVALAALDGKKHRKLLTGPQQELDALIDWLLSQG